MSPGVKRGLKSMKHIMRKYMYSNQYSSQKWLLADKQASISAQIPLLDADLSHSLLKFNEQVLHSEMSSRGKLFKASERRNPMANGDDDE